MKIKSQRVYIDEHFIPAVISFNNGIIDEIDTKSMFQYDVDFRENKILPGLVDIHCHGYQGYSSNVADRKGLNKWQKHLPKEGCTSFVVTTSTADEKQVLKSIQVISSEMDKEQNGARIMGIHVEGPYISFDKCGAHNKYELRKPSASEVDKWESAANNKILLYCIAPEMDENYKGKF